MNEIVNTAAIEILTNPRSALESSRFLLQPTLQHPSYSYVRWPSLLPCSSHRSRQLRGSFFLSKIQTRWPSWSTLFLSQPEQQQDFNILRRQPAPAFFSHTIWVGQTHTHVFTRLHARLPHVCGCVWSYVRSIYAAMIKKWLRALTMPYTCSLRAKGVKAKN